MCWYNIFYVISYFFTLVTLDLLHILGRTAISFLYCFRIFFFWVFFWVAISSLPFTLFFFFPPCVFSLWHTITVWRSDVDWPPGALCTQGVAPPWVVTPGLHGDTWGENGGKLAQKEWRGSCTMRLRKKNPDCQDQFVFVHQLLIDLQETGKIFLSCAGRSEIPSRAVLQVAPHRQID